MERLRQSLNKFYEARPVMSKYNDQPLSLSIGLVKEAAEVLEADQCGQIDKLASEVADCFIYLLLLSQKHGFDLIEESLKKIELNSDRFPSDLFSNGEPFEEMYWHAKIRNGER